MVHPTGPATRPKRVSFLLVPRFSQIALIAAIEPLRMANELAGKELYAWQTVSRDGAPVAASNGLRSPVDFATHSAPTQDLVIVCSGVQVQQHLDHAVLVWLRRLAGIHTALGAVCTGAYMLARAGVLDGYRCTLHWEELNGVQDATLFPQVAFGEELFVIDRDRYTCSGGVVAMDMMLTLVAREHGADLAERIAEEYMHERIRDATERQQTPLRLSPGATPPKLVETIKLMEANIQEPLTLDELAALSRISRRQLERLFQRYLECVPTRYYMNLRLLRSRHMLRQTAYPVTEVGLACGFISPPHFTKCYHQYFGASPSEERRLRRQRLLFGGTQPPPSVPARARAAPGGGNSVRKRTDALWRQE